jgi:hypothetical protein
MCKGVGFFKTCSSNKRDCFYCTLDESDMVRETLCQMLASNEASRCRMEMLSLPAVDPKLSAAMAAVWREAWGHAARLTTDLAGNLLLSVA